MNARRAPGGDARAVHETPYGVLGLPGNQFDVVEPDATAPVEVAHQPLGERDRLRETLPDGTAGGTWAGASTTTVTDPTWRRLPGLRRSVTRSSSADSGKRSARPSAKRCGHLARAAKRLQSGRLDAYLAYMLIALVALLALVSALA